MYRLILKVVACKEVLYEWVKYIMDRFDHVK